MTTFLAILGAVAGLGSAAGAVGAWLAAGHANRTASTLAKIEIDRRHAELKPHLRLDLDESGTAKILTVAIDGPDELDRLDSVEVFVRDDIPERAELTSSVAGGPTQEQIKAQIWGPLRFRYGTDGGSPDGRTVAAFSLPVGESKPLAMEPTLPPRWTGPQFWDQYQGTPLRLTVVCRREGVPEWTFKREIETRTAVEQEIY